MKNILVGVVGHVDHGKTALVRALTGMETDRLPEEKQRGISIALGFAHLAAGPASRIDLIDMPGHERFVRTMVAGASGIDAVLLVVAANEGVKPQTIEHVEIAGLLGLKQAAVAVTKVDLVSAEEAQAAARAAVTLLTEREMTVPFAPALTAAIEGVGLGDLRAALCGLASGRSERPALGVAYLPIDRAFTVSGHGSVVTGTLRGSPIRPGDRLELLPSGREVRVRGIEVHGHAVEVAQPGQRAALNLRQVETSELKRGMALAPPGALARSDWLTIAIRTVADAPPVRNGSRLMVLVGTAEAEARLRLLDADVLESGATGFAQLHFAEPMATPAGERVILRVPSPARTIAGGLILEVETRRLRRNSAPVLERLTELRDLDPPGWMAAEIVRAGAAGAAVERLARLAAVPEAAAREILARLPVVITKTGTAVARAELDHLIARIPPLLASDEEGLGFGRLLASSAGLSRDVLDEALARLSAAGTIMRSGNRFRMPDPEREQARRRGDAELAAHIAETLRTAGLSPPRPAEIVNDPASRRAVDQLLRDGVLVRAVDHAKGKEMLFHADAITEASKRLAPLLIEGAGLLPGEIGGCLGISRKHTMPLLDYLDGAQFTRRIGDRRLAGPALLRPPLQSSHG